MANNDKIKIDFNSDSFFWNFDPFAKFTNGIDLRKDSKTFNFNDKINNSVEQVNVYGWSSANIPHYSEKNNSVEQVNVYGWSSANISHYSEKKNSHSNILAVPPKKEKKEYGQVENVVGYAQGGGWGSFGAYNMAGYGCGPTSIAIALASITGNEEITPRTIADYMEEKGICYEGGTVYSDIIKIEQHFAEIYSTPDKPIYTACISDLDKLKEVLSSGNAVAVTIEQTYRNGYGINLSNGTTMGYQGHYIALTGVSKDRVMAQGENDYDLIIADPANPSNNGLTVSAQEMSICCGNFDYDPSFWVVSTEPIY